MGKKLTKKEEYESAKEYSYYIKKIKKEKINEKQILIESKNGADLAGNMFHILKELSTDAYKDYQVYVVVTEASEEKIKGVIEDNQLREVVYVNNTTKKYLKLLASVKYIFVDTRIPPIFIKKEGQIVVNTWHGTPLKAMGKHVPTRIYSMGNVQKNFLLADYLVYPNDFMREIMVEAYELENLYQGTILCEGYPRNSVFFDKNIGQDIRTKLKLENKNVYIYMPTWRGELTKMESDKVIFYMHYFLSQIDELLTDDEVLYVKLHLFVSRDMDLSRYKHIKDYPVEYDVYEFMNMCDGLITDYSSVFFDFANSRKKIILFPYDEADYFHQRGMYVNFNELPFPIVKDAKSFVDEMRRPKQYDDEAFLKRFCTYDRAGAANRICQHVILGEKVCKEIHLSQKDNKKENVLVYCSSMAKNGLTTSMLNLFENIDLSKRNYFVTFFQDNYKTNPLKLSAIPEGVGFLPMGGRPRMTKFELFCSRLYEGKNINLKCLSQVLDKAYEREMKRFLGYSKFETAIQFPGYEKQTINMFSKMDAKTVIFVHNDMVEELRTKTNQHELTIKKAYREYDYVVAVTEDLVEPTRKLGGPDANIVVVNNCHDYKGVIEKGQQEVAFEVETKGNIKLDKLKDVLASDVTKIVTCGRFSNEKGHMMLMKAFEDFYKKNPKSCLIIIGGYGPLYKQTIDYAKASPADIYVIKSMKNPISVIARCDLFVLSSFYEGLGLTLLEADTVGIPTFSTNVRGPRGFVTEHGGTLVEPTKEAIVQGMLDFKAGKIKAMNVDYEKYNQQAVEQFESIMSN